MSIFDRTFLISTGVTAVICGAIYYYLNTKIRDLEQALVKQNQVLSSFIANVQQEFRAMAMARATGGGGMKFEIVSEANELASPEALAAVAELEHKKIVITESECDSESDSDGEGEESDSDSDSESEPDATADTDSTDNNKLVICDLSLNDMKIIDMSALDMTHSEIYTPEKQSEGESEGENSASESESESDSEEDGFHRVSKLVIEEVNLNVLDLLNTPSKIEDIELEELSTQAVVNVPLEVESQNPVPVAKDSPKYDDLKVDELRKIVLEKGLAQKDEVKKLKKNELLAVLKKHTF